MRLHAITGIVAAGAVLQGCGLFLSQRGAFEPPPPDPPPGWFLEGEVRDFATLAPAADAEVIVTTSRKGYAARTRTDPGGRFSLTVSTLESTRSNGDRLAEAIFFGTGDEPDPRVDALTIRARAGDRCALPETIELRARRPPLQLYLVPCPRAATP
jgi:hypothetical protein